MIKDYRSRVIGTYDFLRAAINDVNQNSGRLLEVGRIADEQTVAEGGMYNPTAVYPLDFELTEEVTPFELKAFSYETDVSEISGDVRVVFGKEPLDLTVPMYQTFRATSAVAPPLAYIVPRQWEDVIEVLKVHGLMMRTLEQSQPVEIESYKLINVRWPEGPFEGRYMPTVDTETVVETREFPSGSVVIPLAQPLAKVAVNLLEPKAPDSFVRWGFFNAIFEEKEYGEHYVLEALAREMLADNPDLKNEFDRRVATDPSFAANPAARLRFFHERSPYWDPQMNLYPVGRIINTLDF